MLDSLFSELTLALTQGFWFSLAASFCWGLVSVLLSPCHLSGIPLVIGYISSHGRIKVKRTFALSLFFAAGSLLTIAIIGVITAALGKMLGDIGNWGTSVVAGMFMLMGLYLMDLVHLNWNPVPLPDEQRGGLWGALVLGLLFGVGLGPCTFAFLAPVLGAVFSIASSNWLKAVLLITAFGTGHAVVIVVAGSMTNLVQYYLNWAGKSQAMVSIKRVTGFVLFIIGLSFVYSALF
jgi:cytochrome c-type biogenesis protein